METMTNSHMTTMDVSLKFNSNYKAGNDQEMAEVVFSYPDDWQKPKFFNNGDRRLLARETAEQFVKAGIASFTDQVENEKKTVKESTLKKVVKK